MEATPHATPAHLRQLELQQEELLLKASKIQGLFQYLNFLDSTAFDRCLGRSGKSPDCLSRAPDGGPTPRKFVTLTTAGQNRKMRQQDVSRSVQINAQRREPATLSAEEVMARLKDVFTAYTDPMLYARTGRREMNIVGFLRLMRDCRLLDNRFTLVTADVIFTRVDAGVDVDGAAGGTVLGDLHVDFGEFMRCLRAVVRHKFPKSRDEQESLLLLARKWVLPFANDSGVGGMAASVDGLFSRSTMNLVRKYDPQLKRLFAWYSSMEETDPSRVSWSWVREHGGTISSSGFVLMLLNFDVLPVLLSKAKALDVFDRCEAANDGDERANRMLYPAFLETISEIALEVGKFVLPRIRAAASPDELKLLRRYAESCPPPHGPKVLQAYQDALVVRGRDPGTLDQHYLYDAEGVRRRNEQKAAAALRREQEAHAAGVLQRREGLRQRFALTRLRNFYRDVRTTNNNDTWPPERDASPQNRVANGAHGAHGGEVMDGEGVHVAFFDAERAIKTPQPVWMPVGHVGSRRYNSNTTVPDLPTPSSVAAAAAAAAAGVIFGGAAGNLLVLETPSGAGGGGGKPPVFLTPTGGGAGQKPSLSIYIPGLSPSSPGAYGVMRSPKPYQLKVSIEDRDEHEAILDLAGRLPYIRTPQRGGDGDAVAGPLGSQSGAAEAAVLQAMTSKPRAVTAPAELRQRRNADCADAEGSGPAAPPLAGERSGAEPAGYTSHDGPMRQPLASEDSRLTASSSRPHLPPVHHQPHRLQATAAALASLAGQPPPPPLLLPQPPHHHPPPPSHLQASVSSHSVAALHLPPAVHHTAGIPPQQQPALPSHQPLAASASSVSLHTIVPLGPSPSQLSALGVVAPALGDSLRSNGGGGVPRGSLNRHRQSQRRRADARGLPHLQLPVESGPSVEVEAALKELDRFDSSMLPVAVA